MYKKIKKNNQIDEMMENSHQRIRIYKKKKREMDNDSYKKTIFEIKNSIGGFYEVGHSWTQT